MLEKIQASNGIGRLLFHRKFRIFTHFLRRKLNSALFCPALKYGISLTQKMLKFHEKVLKFREIKMRSWVPNIENRIYREELKESLGMNFFSPFQPEREFKVYKSYKCSQIICSRVH